MYPSLENSTTSNAIMQALFGLRNISNSKIRKYKALEVGAQIGSGPGCNIIEKFVKLQNYEKVKCEFKNILALLFHSSTTRIVYLIVAKLQVVFKLHKNPISLNFTEPVTIFR